MVWSACRSNRFDGFVEAGYLILLLMVEWFSVPGGLVVWAEVSLSACPSVTVQGI